MNRDSKFSVVCIFFTMIVAVGAAALPSTVYAQSTLDVVDPCLAAIDQNNIDQARELAQVIEADRFVPRFLLPKAERCLEDATGEAWQFVYELSRFVREDEVDQALLEAEAEEATEARIQAERQAEREATLQARRCELLDELRPLQTRRSELARVEQQVEQRLERAALMARLETVETCQTWYQQDTFAALTNPVCSSVFFDVGVSPLDDDSGYSQLEVSSLETQIGILVSQLEILNMGMLPEEALEQALEEERTALIRRLPEDQRDEANELSLTDIGILLTENERALCE